MRICNLLAGIVCCLCIFLSFPSFATAQYPDLIIVDGDEELLHTNPLSAYFKTNPNASLPEGKPCVPGPGDECVTVTSSANWRGYVATWEVSDDNTLLFKQIEVSGTGLDPKVAKEKMFPGVERVVATWYSGALIVPKGKMVNYVHMGYGSTYRRYVILTVDAGVITKKLKLSAKKFKEYRDSQFEAYMKTDEYKAKFKAHKDDDSSMSDELIMDFMYGYEAERYLSMDFSKTK